MAQPAGGPQLQLCVCGHHRVCCYVIGRQLGTLLRAWNGVRSNAVWLQVAGLQLGGGVCDAA
jgi:hypothetical protein